MATETDSSPPLPSSPAQSSEGTGQKWGSYGARDISHVEGNWNRHLTQTGGPQKGFPEEK